MEDNTTEPHLDIPRHIKYWQRCLRSLLPTEYTSTDSSRMTLGFFILSALDILGAGADTEAFSLKQRTEIRDWILKCQHPHGGFCGSPNHRYPDGYYDNVGGEQGKEEMDPANLPATFFALLSLSFVGGLEMIKRAQCLAWLKRLQRPDGSFGELVTNDGEITGGYDMRHCYVLTAVRWILTGRGGADAEKEGDIDVEALVNHLRSGQTYDGGISESSSHEAHAGYTYCGIASLSFLDRLPSSPSSSPHLVAGAGLSPGLTNMPATIHWLVSRQVGYREEDDQEEGEELPLNSQGGLAGNCETPQSIDGLSLQNEDFVGFNGRCNKPADTCYAFWAAASLDMLGEDKPQLLDIPAIRRFLFEQAQHRIGGFGKYPGNPPDIYHSYLGLTALAVMREPGVKPLDSALCVSKQQREKISRLRDTASASRNTHWKNGYSYAIGEENSSLREKMASSEEPPKFLSEAIQVISKNATRAVVS